MNNTNRKPVNAHTQDQKALLATLKILTSLRDHTDESVKILSAYISEKKQDL